MFGPKVAGSIPTVVRQNCRLPGVDIGVDICLEFRVTVSAIFYSNFRLNSFAVTPPQE